MFRKFLLIFFVICFFVIVANPAAAPATNTTENGSETKYLMFQIFTLSNEQIPPAGTDSMTAIVTTARDIKTAIGTTGDKRYKLGFTIGPFAFDNTDEDIRRLIRKSFDVARAENLAVAIHIDDSMFFGTRKDLVDNLDNIEWLDWNKTPNTGRRIDWSTSPSKIAPQMCFNSIEVMNAVVQRADLIGGEIRKGIDSLANEGKEELFAGVIAGWETQIGKDFGTNQSLGYCALSHKGFSADYLPDDIDAERVAIVKEFIELWAKELAKSGIPKEKIYAHIAFHPQGPESSSDHPNGHPSYAEANNFSTPDTAMSSYYRPGFSTYPEPGLFDTIHLALANHGNPHWASCEGTNVIPNGFPGETTMETYLGRMFNHGATLVNIYSWGIGGEALKNTNSFRMATENPEALSAYKKFLDGNDLKEAEALSPSMLFQEKMHKIQRELPSWIQKTHRQDLVVPLMQQLEDLIKSGHFQDADKIADKVLALFWL